MFRFTCSVVLWGRGRCRQMSLACVGSTRSVPATLGLPLLTVRVLPHLHCSGSRLLYRGQALSCVHFPGPSYSGSGSRVLHKDADSVGPAFCAFPAQAAQAARSLTGTLSPGAEHLIPSAVPASGSPRTGVCALCPFWEADFWLRPSQRMSTIQSLRKSLVRNWKPVCSLVGDAIPGAVCPFPLLPASCLHGGLAGPQPASSSLGSLSPPFLGG